VTGASGTGEPGPAAGPATPDLPLAPPAPPGAPLDPGLPPARGEPLRPDAGRLAALGVLPRITLESDGGTVAREAVASLVALRVQQRLSLPTLCELTFRDPPGPLAVASTLTPGAALRVLVAPPAAGVAPGQPLPGDGALGALDTSEMKPKRPSTVCVTSVST